MTLNNLEKGRTGIPKRADLPRVFLAFAQEKLDGLRQSFMAFGQSIQALIDSHVFNLPQAAAQLIFLLCAGPAILFSIVSQKFKPTHCAV